MPNCFTLTRKSDPKAGPVKFATIDDEMRRYFNNKPQNDDDFLLNWYDFVGWKIAVSGWSWQQIITDLEKRAHEWVTERGDPFAAIYLWQVARAVRWLAENFTADSWVEIGRRN